MKLFELLETINYAKDKLESQYGEIFDEDIYIEAEIDESAEFWSNYLIQKYKEFRSMENSAKELADHYKARAEMFSNYADQKSEMIKLLIQHLGNNLKTPSGSASLSKSGRESVEILVDVSQLPQEFVVVKETPDKKALKAALENGATIDGVNLVIGEKYVTVR